MDFIRENQLNFMLIMSGICGILAVLTLMPRFLSRKRRSILCLMELSSMFLLYFDRLSYIYRGNTGETAGVIVRISNGMVYFLILLVLFLVARFIEDLYRNEGGLKTSLRRFFVCDMLFVIGTGLVIVSQFTGWYYTIDAQNLYQRGPGHAVSYIVPFLIVVILESVIFQYRTRLNRGLESAIAISLLLPTAASVIQFFAYGVSLTNITMVVVVIVFYIYSLCSLGAQAEEARKRELEFYKEARKKEAALFEQTTEALANAIDAKDKYTHGHSARVAVISKKIAQEYGLSEEECSQVYFAALLHDVGKIGIRDEVINKTGKLTDEEFEHIKTHPVQGNQILSSIRQSPYLSIGAHYHHERYDGKGYPEGLLGEQIPQIARIIAVADAYDAMTSTRSYRNALSKEKVMSEIAAGSGKQFDPDFAEIMLRLIERDDSVCAKN